MGKNKINPWKIIGIIVIASLAGTLVMCTNSHARDTSVNGYVRSDGTYVPPHYRSAPDNNPYNNYGSQGNYNPYTGQQGTVQPQPNYAPQPYYGNPYGNNRGNSSIGPYGR